jgi:hypothetical protein
LIRSPSAIFFSPLSADRKAGSFEVQSPLKTTPPVLEETESSKDEDEKNTKSQVLPTINHGNSGSHSDKNHSEKNHSEKKSHIDTNNHDYSHIQSKVHTNNSHDITNNHVNDKDKSLPNEKSHIDNNSHDYSHIQSKIHTNNSHIKNKSTPNPNPNPNKKSHIDDKSHTNDGSDGGSKSNGNNDSGTASEVDINLIKTPSEELPSIGASDKRTIERTIEAPAVVETIKDNEHRERSASRVTFTEEAPLIMNPADESISKVSSLSPRASVASIASTIVNSGL